MGYSLDREKAIEDAFKMLQRINCWCDEQNNDKYDMAALACRVLTNQKKIQEIIDSYYTIRVYD